MLESEHIFEYNESNSSDTWYFENNSEAKLSVEQVALYKLLDTTVIGNRCCVTYIKTPQDHRVNNLVLVSINCKEYTTCSMNVHIKHGDIKSFLKTHGSQYLLHHPVVKNKNRVMAFCIRLCVNNSFYNFCTIKHNDNLHNTLVRNYMGSHDLSIGFRIKKLIIDKWVSLCEPVICSL